MSEVKDVIVQGLWKNNSALVQLLGMCPLLAVTSTATNALGLGLATTLVLTLTNLTISSLRRWTPAEIRIPIYVMIIASVVSVVQMLINAYAFGLYQSLGIFIPLIVTNCIVVGRAEAFAAKKGPALSALDDSRYDIWVVNCNDGTDAARPELVYEPDTTPQPEDVGEGGPAPGEVVDLGGEISDDSGVETGEEAAGDDAAAGGKHQRPRPPPRRPPRPPRRPPTAAWAPA